VQLFDPQRDPPVAVTAGDYIRFAPITEEAYHDIQRQVRTGSYQLTTRDRQ
jgi:allophanate hydrolase subunit 1